jgi:hypothetical protein
MTEIGGDLEKTPEVSLSFELTSRASAIYSEYFRDGN